MIRSPAASFTLSCCGVAADPLPRTEADRYLDGLSIDPPCPAA